MSGVITVDEKQYISLADAKVNNVHFDGDTLLYIDNPRYGFDSCSQLRYNNISGRENEFYIEYLVTK